MYIQEIYFCSIFSVQWGRVRLEICPREAVTLTLLEDMAPTQATAWSPRHMLDLTCLPLYHIL